MFLTYTNPVYDYVKSADQQTGEVCHHSVIVVGAGPIGMGAALDLGQYGRQVLVLDDNNTVSVGSRAVCYSKRALEVLDRLGCAERMIDKGVSWQVGKMFFRDELVSRFDLLPDAGFKQPAFINLQQYYLEEYMVDRMNALDSLEVRWKNRVTAVEQDASRVYLTVDTPDGEYRLSCDWLIAADGANSDVRRICGLDSSGRVFKDRFLIADIVMKANFPAERWFHFDPSFHRGQSTLLHRQSDDVWRLDFQLGWDKDPEVEKRPENVIPRVKAMMGEDVEFELEWASVYTFQCRRMAHFRQQRILFAGDAAHQVSPFGARGANSGLQDTDNLAWKLKLVIEGRAPEKLLDSYCEEREFAADENILNSSRATDFITPKSKASRVFRDATLELSKRFHFAQKLTNSGRLSEAAFLTGSSLNTEDRDEFAGQMVPGAVAADAPLSGADGETWLVSALANHFHCVLFTDSPDQLDQLQITALKSLQSAPVPVLPLLISRTKCSNDVEGVPCLHDHAGLAAERYDARPGTAYLLRPDQHVCARWRDLDATLLEQALLKATAQ